MFREHPLIWLGPAAEAVLRSQAAAQSDNPTRGVPPPVTERDRQQQARLDRLKAILHELREEFEALAEVVDELRAFLVL